MEKLAKGAFVSDVNLKMFLRDCLGPSSQQELKFLSECLREGMRYYLEVECRRRRFLRLPHVLSEPSYVADLRNGSAFRALRRIHLMCRLERVVTDSINDTISGEERLV